MFVEFMLVDLPTAYQHAFVFIRQLAMILREALNMKTKVSLFCAIHSDFEASAFMLHRIYDIKDKRYQCPLSGPYRLIQPNPNSSNCIHLS